MSAEPRPEPIGAGPSLRNRVAIALAVFSGVIALALATVIFLAFQDLERHLVDDTLIAELDDYVARRHRNPDSLPERTATIRAFVVASRGGTAPVPDAVAALAPGRHYLELEGRPYRAAVRQVNNQRFVVLYDMSASQRRERGILLLLLGSVLLFTTIAALSGRWLAGRSIAPVTELARSVATQRPEDPPQPLADRFPWEEVRRLAADFDSYLSRLHHFIERERLFTGDISHELRTPLAVIQGATDLLLSDPEITARNRKRIERINRATGEMGEIAGALLALAREQDATPVERGSCDVEAVAREVVARHQELFRGKPVKLGLKVDARPKIRADDAVLAMVLGNLLRNALSFTESGEVWVRIESDAVLVEDTGPGIDPKQGEGLFRPRVKGPESSGSGIGLSLVQRLCDRQGWHISLVNRQDGGARARLDFTLP
jgi:signal transduction histidine kinase